MPSAYAEVVMLSTNLSGPSPVKWFRETEGKAMPTLHITKLECKRKQDVTGQDEPRITVNGDTAWGPGKMDKGDSQPLNVSVDFAEVAEVKVQEMNNNRPKDIGPAQLIRVGRPGSPVDFSTSGAHYVLSYDIRR
jgi:hypothetical protein